MYYHIPKKLQPSLENIDPEMPFDQNHKVAAKWVKVCLLISKNFEALDKCGHERFNLPRILWLKKTWSLAKVHHVVYKHFRQLFVNWMNEPMAKDGKTAKCKTEATYYLPQTKKWDFEKGSKTQGLAKLTAAALNDGLVPVKEEFSTFFPMMGQEPDSDDQKVEPKVLSPYPYDLILYDRYMKKPKKCAMCCQWSNNHSCSLHFDEHMTVLDLLDRIPCPRLGDDQVYMGKDNNQSFYLRPGNSPGSGDLVLNMIWHSDF